jgi:hypothetical protein
MLQVIFAYRGEDALIKFGTQQEMTLHKNGTLIPYFTLKISKL